MKVSQLLEGIEIVSFDLEVDFEENIKDISFDSRDLKKRSPFFAFKGVAFDSHVFAKDAYESGRVPFVVAEHKIDDVPTVVVADGRKALSMACKNFFGCPDEELIKAAVTGTNGKTTVAYIIESIMKSAGHKPVKVGTTGVSFASEYVDLDSTTPSPYDFWKILRRAVDEGCDSLVMEVSSHALDQHRVFGIVFDVAIFTNLSGDHLDYHKTMDDYFEAKQKLFTRDYSTVGVIGIDNEYGAELSMICEVDKITYGISPKTDVAAHEIWFDLDGISATFVCPAGNIEIKSQLVGLHNLENILASAAGCIMLGISSSHIKEGVAKLDNVPGRLEKFKKDNGAFIFVDYAHTDDAIKNVLEALSNFRENRVITVFGCGGDRDRSKRPRMAAAAEKVSDVVIVTNDNPRTEDQEQIFGDILEGFENAESVIITPDRKQAIQQAVCMAEDKDIVLIAGKGHEDYMIIGTEKIHFDDREEVRNCLEGGKC